MTYLEVRAGNTFCELVEQWHHHFLKFCRFDDVQDLFELVEKHDLLRRMDLEVENMD